MSKPLRNRLPHSPLRWDIRAGAGCRRTPGCLRYEPRPELSGPGRPGDERRSRTGRKNKIKADFRFTADSSYEAEASAKPEQENAF